jgi:signal transduction histidine kinase
MVEVSNLSKLAQATALRPSSPDYSHPAPPLVAGTVPTARIGGLAAARWPRLRLPARTVRLRLTVLYGSLFTLSGAILLAITYLLVVQFTDRLRVTTGLNGTHGVPFGSTPPMPSPAAVSHLHNSYQHQLPLLSGIALAIMAIVSVWLGWLMAGRVLRPLRSMTATTRRISQENLHERLHLAGPRDELKDLGDTVDELLARLETAFEAQRRFVANASHELRTPLTMMRTSLDVAEGKPPPVPREVTVLASKVREGLDQADRLIESFLTLARAHQSTPAENATIVLGDIAAAAVAAHQRQAAELGVHMHRRLTPVEVTGDATLLRRLIDNLLDNALRNNHPGGNVEIDCYPQPDGAGGVTARLVIANTGARLDNAEVAQLGQPFHRLSPDRTTTESIGLGLSIVTAIAAAHDGTVHLHAQPEGGLHVAVDLPCAIGTATPKAAR